ncbi:autotransporter domain-containing protein, partial [Phenylobacterium sp.]|uniref:autotransporter domain-containing protein n=1 Tax=Phenylobacterium sp. TaxID=1871053 RepID=UPI00199F1933
GLKASSRRLGASHLAILAVLGVSLAAPATALAAPGEILSGDYLKVGLSGDGTLGIGGNTSPGILYDGAGTGTFNTAYDYLTPGSPFEGFTVSGNGGGVFSVTNNNDDNASSQIAGTLTSYNGVVYDGTTYDQRAVWSGTYGGLFNLTHDYYFDTDGQQLNIATTIEALADLTDLAFARFTDPDAVAAPGDSSATNNFRGATGVPESDLVYAEATVSKYVIGLYSGDATTHSTGVTGWTTDPASYLSGTFVGNGDNTIGLGFDIGSLLNGARITLKYSYIFGTDIAAAVNAGVSGGGGTPTAPTPSIQEGGSYTVGDLLGGGVAPVFDGGVLTLGSSGEVGTNFNVTGKGGVIDTAGNDLTLTGVLAGDGVLTKVGSGVLTLTGANSFQGVNHTGGILAINSDQALGAPIAPLSLSGGGRLRLLSDVTSSRSLTIGAGQSGVVDTFGSNLTLDGAIGGGGTLQKTGAGVLTLKGPSALSVLDIQQGSVLALSPASLGVEGGKIQLQGTGALSLGSDLTIGQTLELTGGETLLDTGAHQVTLAGPVEGGGDLRKGGSGVLNLQGTNTFANLEVLQGAVRLGSAASAGDAAGDLILHTGGAVQFGSNMTLTKNVVVLGPDATFDTAGSDIVLAGTISGRNCFTKTGVGHLTLAAPGANAIGACVEQGQLSFNNLFAGNVWVDPGAKLSGGGRIVGGVEVAGILAPGNSPGRLVVEGAVTQTAGATLLIDIDGPTPGSGAGFHDQLVLIGADAVFTAGGALTPITRGITGAATNTYTPVIGQAFRIVEAQGGVVGAFDTLVQPTEGMPENSRFEVVYQPNAIVLAVTPESYARFAAGQANAQAGGGLVDALRSQGEAAGVQSGLAAGLVGLSAQGMDLVLQQSAGETHAQLVEASLDGARADRATVAGRLATAFTAERNVWGQAVAGRHDRKADDRADGFDADRQGLMIGADRLVGDVVAGAAFGYAETKLDAGAMGTGRVLSYRALAYAGWRPGDHYVDAVASAGIETAKANRSVALSSGPLGAYGKTEGRSFGFDLEGGRIFRTAQGQFALAAGLAGDRLTQDGHAEAGDADIALRLDEATREGLQARVGGRFEGAREFGGVTLRPRAELFLTRELGDEATRLDASLQGQTFQVWSAEAGRDGVRGALQLDAEVNARTRIGLAYRFARAGEADSQAAALSASFTW